MRELPDGRVEALARKHRELAVYATMYQHSQITYEEALVRMLAALDDKLALASSLGRELGGLL